MPKDEPTPFKLNGRRNSEARVNIPRAESPDCPNQTTDTSFISREELETRFNAASASLRMPFLFRELGLRLLYNSDNDNYYSHLRSQNTYQDDFTSSTSNIDYGHKLFSNIRNNHRFLKAKIKEGPQINNTEKEIKFSEEVKIKEIYQSALYFYKRMQTQHYLDTLEQEVSYSWITGYASYSSINRLINSIAKAHGYSSISESFKQILRGEEVNHANLDQDQIKIIYSLFYHLFVIEGSRDPASYINIPLALEYLANHRGDISSHNLNLFEIIPICFKDAMQALSYMGDVTFKSLTSIQYGHSYNGTQDFIERNRIAHTETIQRKTNSLLKKYLNLAEEQDLPDFSFTLNMVEDICRQWYGFTPQMEAPQIQFFGQLGLTATDVPRDGNCFFHVLANYYEADPSELREFAANLLDNDSIIEDGNWMDLNFAEIAQALALEWDVNIVLVQQNVELDQIDTMLEANLYRANTPDAETIYIGNIGNMHFVDLTPERREEFTQLQAAVDRIVNPQPPAAEEPLENLRSITRALEQAANESNDEEEYDSSSNSTVHALYRIDYDDLDFLNHKKIDQPYQLTVDEKHIIDNFISQNNECNYSTEHKVVILPQEISDFTLNDMSIVLGEMLNLFSQ